MNKLPAVYQLLLSLFHQEEMSYLEIIRNTGLPEGTVKSYLFRARKSLKQHLLFHYKRESNEHLSDEILQGLVLHEEDAYPEGAIDLRFSKKGSLYAGNDSLLLQEAVQELVLHGYDSKNRMERIYAKGGIPALISELGRMKLDNLQHQYIDWIFTADSLSQTELMSLFKLVRSMDNDEEKIRLLSKFTTAQLDSSEVARVFFSAIDSIGQDYAKHRVIQQLIEQDSLSSFITEICWKLYAISMPDLTSKMH